MPASTMTVATRKRTSLNVSHAARPRPAYAPSASHNFIRKSWWTGEDSNLRSSKERQIYSLLPLTARPPVHDRTELSLKSASNFCGGTGKTTRNARTYFRTRTTRAGKKFLKECVPLEEPARRYLESSVARPRSLDAGKSFFWSWRRDSNP